MALRNPFRRRVLLAAASRPLQGRPRKRTRRRERGAALIMVLGSLVILSVMLAQSGITLEWEIKRLGEPA